MLNPSMRRARFSTSIQTEVKKHTKNLLNLYNQPSSLILSRGKGSVLYDTAGKKYLDFNAGIAVNALGHGDAGVVAEIADQAAKLIHISNLYHNEYAGPLATAICDAIIPKDNWKDHKVFFSNSGTEANEAAIKFCRKYAKYTFPDKAQKVDVLSFGGAFHGRTFGSLSATHTAKYQTPFFPLLSGFKAAPFNDTSAALSAITDNVCAVLVEPIQGEGGIHPATNDFLAAVRKQCDLVGALLVADEIQCGLGRSGSIFAYQKTGIVPDVLTLVDISFFTVGKAFSKWLSPWSNDYWWESCKCNQTR